MGKKIVLKGKTSDWYQSATFVLKDHVSHSTYPNNLESYAEEIIENYLKKGGRISRPSKYYKWIDCFFYISMALLLFVSCVWFLLKI